MQTPWETIRSVSIGYDVTSCWNEVETLLDRHLAYCDAHFCGHPDVGLRPGPQGGAAEEEILGPLAMRRNMEEDSQWVQDWKEIDLGFRVFQVLVPGVLFTPCLLSPLNNFLIPYFRESALLVLFGQGKSGREAERFLEPLPIGLAWDYQGHVTLPCCCCLTLFIMSPSMWWAQAYLCEHP
eukprot:g33347.t1